MASIIEISGKKIGVVVSPIEINVTNEIFKSKKPERQVSFITLEGKNRIQEDPIKGFCHSRYRADFVVEGLSLEELKIRDQLIIGTTIIEVTEISKECYDNCPAITWEDSCGVNKMTFFGIIIREGIVKLEDELRLI